MGMTFPIFRMSSIWRARGATEWMAIEPPDVRNCLVVVISQAMAVESMKSVFERSRMTRLPDQVAPRTDSSGFFCDKLMLTAVRFPLDATRMQPSLSMETRERGALSFMILSCRRWEDLWRNRQESY